MSGKWRGSGENRNKGKKGKERRVRLKLGGAEERAYVRVEKGNTGLWLGRKRGYLGQRKFIYPLLGFSELLFCPTPNLTFKQKFNSSPTPKYSSSQVNIYLVE